MKSHQCTARDSSAERSSAAKIRGPLRMGDVAMPHGSSLIGGRFGNQNDNNQDRLTLRPPTCHQPSTGRPGRGYAPATGRPHARWTVQDAGAEKWKTRSSRFIGFLSRWKTAAGGSLRKKLKRCSPEERSLEYLKNCDWLRKYHSARNLATATGSGEEEEVAEEEDGEAKEAASFALNQSDPARVISGLDLHGQLNTVIKEMEECIGSLNSNRALPNVTVATVNETEGRSVTVELDDVKEEKTKKKNPASIGTVAADLRFSLAIALNQSTNRRPPPLTQMKTAKWNESSKSLPDASPPPAPRNGPERKWSSAEFGRNMGTSGDEYAASKVVDVMSERDDGSVCTAPLETDLKAKGHESESTSSATIGLDTIPSLSKTAKLQLNTVAADLASNCSSTYSRRLHQPLRQDRNRRAATIAYLGEQLPSERKEGSAVSAGILPRTVSGVEASAQEKPNLKKQRQQSTAESASLPARAQILLQKLDRSPSLNAMLTNNNCDGCRGVRDDKNPSWTKTEESETTSSPCQTYGCEGCFKCTKILTSSMLCERCDGKGQLVKTEPIKWRDICVACEGAGSQIGLHVCETCGGNGHMGTSTLFFEETCEDCEGSGSSILSARVGPGGKGKKESGGGEEGEESRGGVEEVWQENFVKKASMEGAIAGRSMAEDASSKVDLAAGSSPCRAFIGENKQGEMPMEKAKMQANEEEEELRKEPVDDTLEKTAQLMGKETSKLLNSIASKDAPSSRN